MPRHIGIVAVSPEGSALCYREIFRHTSRLIGDTGHPRITLHNEPFELYLEAALKADWHTVATLLRKSAETLAAAGAEFCITPDNLMQNAVHLAEVGSKIPWLTMTDAVAEAVARDGRKTVGLLATSLVTFGSTYQTHLGMRGCHLLVPDQAEAEAIDTIIFQELVHGVVRSESRTYLINTINKLCARGCEGVVLGYTEAPLLLSSENSPLPIYDSTSLLAEAAVKVSLGMV
ncbi:MAG: amino acid racemase [Pyrinomonadaceae bacterium]|nr:amino acid racemase [Phycisphaerales bacterium]